MKIKRLLGTALCFFLSFNFFGQLSIDTLPFTTDGPVSDVYKRGDRYFIGGYFTRAGTRNDYLTKLDSSKKFYHFYYPYSNYPVMRACSDNSGGYFVHGGFSVLGDSSRTELAHFNSTNGVTNFKPAVFGYFSGSTTSINKMLCYGNYLIVCGTFPGGINIYNTTTSQMLPSPVIANNNVFDMEIKNNKLYMVGSFDSVNYVKRKHFACIDLPSFTVSSYMPVYLNTQYWQTYSNIEILDTTLVMSGNFQYNDNFNQPIAFNLIEFSLGNGSYKSRFYGYNNTPNYSWYSTMRAFGDTIFLSRDSIIDIYRLTTSTVTTIGAINTHTWNGFTDAARDNAGFYITGDFKKANNTLVNGVFRIPNASITPTIIPYVNQFSTARYSFILRGNDHLLLGGNFQEHGLENCTYFVCYDNKKKQIVYKPNITNLILNPPPYYVKKIKEYKNKVYVTGYFHDVNSQFKPGIFVIDVNTYSVQSTPSFVLGPCTFSDHNIYDIQFVGNWMYIYGYISDVNGVNKNDYAKINLTTNAVSPNSYICSGSTHLNFKPFNPMAVWNNNVYVFPTFNYYGSGSPCYQAIWGLDSITMSNCTDICARDTSLRTYIEDVHLRGNKLYCIDRENAPFPEPMRAYSYDFSTNTYSSVYFDAACQWTNYSRHSTFYKNYWVVMTNPGTLNGSPNSINLQYVDTLSSTLVSPTSFNPSNYVSALYSNDTVLVCSSYPNAGYLFKTSLTSYDYSKIYIMNVPGGITTNNNAVTGPVSKSGFDLYPNPAQGEIIIKGKSVILLEVYNNVGQLIVRKTSDVGRIDVSRFESGVYIVKTTDKTGSCSTAKFIKQ
jgi:hypothetical protein